MKQLDMLNRLWNAELSSMPERYRPWVSAFVVFFTAMFFVQFPLLWHNLVYLGLEYWHFATGYFVIPCLDYAWQLLRL